MARDRDSRFTNPRPLSPLQGGEVRTPPKGVFVRKEGDDRDPR